MKFLEPDNYQPKCDELFVKYEQLVKRILPRVRIEHIGSSAIEGVISKGDLDILIAVDRSEHSDAIHVLGDAGFRVKADTLRTDELCMMEAQHDDVALQVVVSGSSIDLTFTGFRNALKKSVDLRNAYNALKIASAGLSMEDYRQRKSKFIEDVLRQ